MDEEILNVIEYIDLYYIPTFLSLSLLGNCLSVYVLFCTKLRYNSSSIYLGALAMSDIGVLMTVFIMWFQWIEIIPYEIWLEILLTGSLNIFVFLSVWIVVAFTVQRYLMIKWPLRHYLCTINLAKIIVIGLTGLAVLYSIPWFIYRSVQIKKSDANEDMTNLNWLWWILYIIAFIITCIIPAIIISIFNALIVYNMRKQNRIRRNLIPSSSASNQETQSSDSKASHIEVTKMLVIISSLFICLNIPKGIAIIYYAYKGRDIYSKFALFIANLLMLTNYGMDFVLYCATGKNFRTELIRMFTKSSDTRRNIDIRIENFKD